MGVLLVALLVSLTAPVALSERANAHDQIVTATPGENESLAVAPERAVIEFSDELLQLPEGTTIVVTDPSGAELTTGDVAFDGRIVSRALLPSMPNGQYRLVWSVVSADGHPITNSYFFAVGEPVNPAAFDAQAEAESPDVPAPDVIEPMPISAGLDDGSGLWRTVLIGVSGAAVAVAGVALVFALSRRAKRRTANTADEHSQTPPHTESSKK